MFVLPPSRQFSSRQPCHWFFFFFWVFQSSELITASRCDTSGCALVVTDISIKGSELHVCLFRSKIDQNAWGVNIILYSGPRDMPCPVLYTGQYLSLYGAIFIKQTMNLGASSHAWWWHMLIMVSVCQCFLGMSGKVGFLRKRFWGEIISHRCCDIRFWVRFFGG